MISLRASTEPSGYYHLKFKLPGLPKTTNGSRGSIWSHSGHQKMWRTKVKNMALIMGAPPKPLTQAAVIYVRYSSSPIDYDNLVISFKPLQDGLVDAGIILNDSMKVIGAPVYCHQPAKRGAGYITIEVFEILEPTHV